MTERKLEQATEQAPTIDEHSGPSDYATALAEHERETFLRNLRRVREPVMLPFGASISLRDPQVRALTDQLGAQAAHEAAQRYLHRHPIAFSTLRPFYFEHDRRKSGRRFLARTSLGFGFDVPYDAKGYELTVADDPMVQKWRKFAESPTGRLLRYTPKGSP